MIMASYDNILDDILQKSVNTYQVLVQEVSLTWWILLACDEWQVGKYVECPLQELLW